MDVSKLMKISLPPIPGESEPLPLNKRQTSTSKVKPVDEYDDSLSEGEIRDSDDGENIEDDGVWLSALVDSNTVDMEMAVSEANSSGEVSDNDVKNQKRKADDGKDPLENADWDTSEYPDTSGADWQWHPDQDSATPSVIQKQTNFTFENQYNPDGPPIDYYIPWIMRQTKYDSQPYYRPIPILDDAYYMYDWDFGEPFKENEPTELLNVGSQGSTFSVRSGSQSQEIETEKKKPDDSNSSDSDDEKSTSLIRRVRPDLTPAQPIRTLCHQGKVLGWLQCMFCGRMFLESMAFDNHVKYMHGKESKCHNKQIWQPRAFKIGHSWKCEVCLTHEGNAGTFLGHLKSLFHLSNLVTWGDWEMTGYADGQLQPPTPGLVTKTVAYEEISDKAHSRWYMLCMLCRRCLDAKDYLGKLVPSGTSLDFSTFQEFLKHIISYHSDENFTSEMLKLILHLVKLGSPELLPTCTLKTAAGFEGETHPPIQNLLNLHPGLICYHCGYKGHKGSNCPSKYLPKSSNPQNWQVNSNLQAMTATLQSMSGGANMTLTGGQGQYAGWNNVNTSVPATATTSAYTEQLVQSGSGSQYRGDPNDAQSSQYRQPQQGKRGRPDTSREDSETPPRGRRRRRYSDSSEDGYDSDEARLGSRIHHAARRRGSRDQRREGSHDEHKTGSSSYPGEPEWGASPYRDKPPGGTSSYHDALLQYRSITDERRMGSSSHEEKRRRRERRERYDARAPSPEAYVDQSGKQVIDYHNKAYSGSIEDVLVKQEPDYQAETESPATQKMPDFMDLANILQTVNKQSARKQQIRAQGMTELLKTLYSSKGAPDTTSQASSSAGKTNLNVFDTMQKTIHKILRDEKKSDQPEPTKGGSTRLAIMKITEKLYKDEFAEGTQLCDLLVERVVKDFVAVKSAGSVSGPAGPVILDPRIRAVEEEKAQLTVLIRRHAEELRLIQEAKKLAQTVDMSSSEEEVEEEEADTKEEKIDPLAAQKKLLLIAYGVILDALAPGAIQSAEDSQIAADIILQLTHHMFNLLNQTGIQTSNTIGLQEKYLIIGQLKSRYQADHPLISALECAICISLDAIRELCKLDIDSLNKLPAILGEQPGLAFNAFQDLSLLQEIVGAHFDR